MIGGAVQPSMKALLAASLAAALLAPGCLADVIPGLRPSFHVVHLTGTIVGEGPKLDAEMVACAPPPIDASIDFEARTLGRVYRENEVRLPYRLVLVDDVRLEDPAARTIGCGAWTVFRAARDGVLNWSMSVHGIPVSVSLETAGDRVLVNGESIGEGGTATVPVRFNWSDPDSNFTYRYSGELAARSHGVWPPSVVEEASERGTLSGRKGTWLGRAVT
jgi:hypothetical protein